MRYKDNFNNMDEFNKNWTHSEINDANINIDNNILKMTSGSAWSGSYVQLNKTLNLFNLIIEFDYQNSCPHYSSADSPYIALIKNNGEYTRDDRYNMIDHTSKDKALIIYFLDDYDTYDRTKIHIKYGNKEIISKNINYHMDTKIHVKLILKNGHIILYIDNTIIIDTTIDELKTSELYKFEINNNSYGNFDSYISNLVINNNMAKYKIISRGFSYIVNKIDGSNKLISTDLENDGFYDITSSNTIIKELSDKEYNLIKMIKE